MMPTILEGYSWRRDRETSIIYLHSYFDLKYLIEMATRDGQALSGQLYFVEIYIVEIYKWIA
jgi:hypothetical protein